MSRPKSPRRNARPSHPSRVKHRGGPSRAASRSAGAANTGCLLVLILALIALGVALTH